MSDNPAVAGVLEMPPNIDTWGEALAWGMALLDGVSNTPKEDVLRLLTDRHDLGMMTIHAQQDLPMPQANKQQLAMDLMLRLQGQPIAYITQRQDFWAHAFWVNADVLIPRPDTEVLVTWALSHSGAKRFLELGVGSGAVILSVAKARPSWSCVGVDVSHQALAVARLNRKRLQAPNVQLCQSDWFEALHGQRFDLICANPPYIAEHDPHLQTGDVRHEPDLALSSGTEGLDAIQHLITCAPLHLSPGGWLGLEHGHTQAHLVATHMMQHGFTSVETQHDLGGQPRITYGQWGD